MQFLKYYISYYNINLNLNIIKYIKNIFKHKNIYNIVNIVINKFNKKIFYAKINKQYKFLNDI